MASTLAYCRLTRRRRDARSQVGYRAILRILLWTSMIVGCGNSKPQPDNSPVVAPIVDP